MESGQNTQAVLMYLVKVARSANVGISDITKALQRQYILTVLTECKFNQCHAAKAMGIHRNTLTRNMAQLGIERRATTWKRSASWKAQSGVVIGV